MNKLILFLCLAATLLNAQKYALLAETVYTNSGKPITNGIVLVNNGKIERVGLQSEIPVPAGYTLLKNKVLTPGFIDVHTSAGVSGAFNYPHDQEQLERSDPIQPELRAADAYNPNDLLIPYLRSFGITTINSGSSEGALVGGQTVIVKTTGKVVSPLPTPHVFITFSLSDDVRSNFKKPGTRSKALAMLRDELSAAHETMNKKSGEENRNLRQEQFIKILKGEAKAIITAHTAVDILAALRLAAEFKFTPIIDGAAEAYLVLKELKEFGVTVLLHATMERAGGETKNISFNTAAKLAAAGIPFAIKSGYEAYVPKNRIILFEAAVAAANGLSFEHALASITSSPAKILGLESSLGFIQEGFSADLVLFDGNPFEYRTHVCTVMIDGIVTDTECR